MQTLIHKITQEIIPGKTSCTWQWLQVNYISVWRHNRTPTRQQQQQDEECGRRWFISAITRTCTGMPHIAIGGERGRIMQVKESLATPTTATELWRANKIADLNDNDWTWLSSACWRSAELRSLQADTKIAARARDTENMSLRIHHS